MGIKTSYIPRQFAEYILTSLCCYPITNLDTFVIRNIRYEGEDRGKGDREKGGRRKEKGGGRKEKGGRRKERKAGRKEKKLEKGEKIKYLSF